MPLDLKPTTRCRSCESPDLAEVLNLGSLAISDFPDEQGNLEHAPLTLLRCESCTLVQLQHTVPRERLYQRYWYLSGMQESMVAALKDVVDHARSLMELKPGDVVLDIGANDGTLLKHYPDFVTRLAFEPAENLWTPLRHSGATLIGGFFPSVVAGQVVGLSQKAKVITSIACFYDVDDPNQFVRAIKECLAEDGVWINQMAYLPATLRTNNFGDICHEHLTYWHYRPFARLLAQHGLQLRDVRFNDVNGGSVRWVACHADELTARETLEYLRLVRFSDDDLDLAGFAQRIEKLRADTFYILQSLARAGQKVYGYGASTKGNTMLQYYGIGSDLVPAIADRNPDKWGKRTVTGIPIISEEQMREERPDYLLVLPFHFLGSFMARERAFLERGGRFIVPLPQLRTVGVESANFSTQSAA